MTISITRVYTRTGDRGETALVGGRRVPKDAPRIVAYGTIDELNAVVGLVRVFNEERLAAGGPAAERHRWLDATLRKVQNQLFDLGSELATPPDAAYDGMFRVGEGEVTELERIMDGCQKDLEPLKSFVLPGGGRIQGFLHQARTVCRRAEREILVLSRTEPIGQGPLTYVNRLSDLLFVLARWVGQRLGDTLRVMKVDLQRCREVDPQILEEIRRIYFTTTKQTIQNDLTHAIDLLKSLPDEETREKATVYMEGLAQMRRDWRTSRSKVKGQRSKERSKVKGKVKGQRKG